MKFVRLQKTSNPSIRIGGLLDLNIIASLVNYDLNTFSLDESRITTVRTVKVQKCTIMHLSRYLPFQTLGRSKIRTMVFMVLGKFTPVLLEVVHFITTKTFVYPRRPVNFVRNRPPFKNNSFEIWIFWLYVIINKKHNRYYWKKSRFSQKVIPFHFLKDPDLSAMEAIPRRLLITLRSPLARWLDCRLLRSSDNILSHIYMQSMHLRLKISSFFECFTFQYDDGRS